jgi:hypothetical protein
MYRFRGLGFFAFSVLVMIFWWLLPLIAEDGLISSTDTALRIAGYVLWFVLGLFFSCAIVAGNMEKLRRLRK